MFPRGLTADQLLSSIEQSTGGSMRNFNNENFVFQQFGELGDRFALAEEETRRYETSILQALELMNGRLTNQQAQGRRAVRGMRGAQPIPGQLVGAVTQSPFMSSRERIETLFLATVSRPPTEAEFERLTKYVASPGDALVAETKLLGQVAKTVVDPPAVSQDRRSLLSALADAFGGSERAARTRQSARRGR